MSARRSVVIITIAPPDGHPAADTTRQALWTPYPSPPMTPAARLAKSQQPCLRGPALPARAALHMEHCRLDRQQLAIALDQAGYRQRCEMPALAPGHPDIARWRLSEVP
jgi:hypothetical protein